MTDSLSANSTYANLKATEAEFKTSITSYAAVGAKTLSMMKRNLTLVEIAFWSRNDTKAARKAQEARKRRRKKQ